MFADVVLLTSNLILAGVTTWYAILTLRLSRSAHDSAKSSEEAARAALQSALVAHANLRVDFAITPVRQSDENDSFILAGIFVECVGANLYVHGARLDSWGRQRFKEGLGVHESMVELGEDLVFAGVSAYEFRVGPHVLPLLLHATEVAEFDLPETLDIPDVSNLGVTIFYSLDGQSEPRERFVEWYAPGSINRR